MPPRSSSSRPGCPAASPSRWYRWLRWPSRPRFALLIGYFSVQRSGIYFAMLTFAFQMLLYTIALKATSVTGGDDGMTGLKPPGLLAKPFYYYYFALALIAPALYVLYRLVSSPFGFTLRALRANPRRVQYIGVNVRAHQLVAFVISGAFAGLAGALFALSTGNVFPGWLNWTASATPIVMAVLAACIPSSGRPSARRSTSCSKS
jgi:branched-chain amino acid transport system permease protein